MIAPYLNFKSEEILAQAPPQALLRSEVVELLFKTDNGEKFSFEGREYLKEIYNTNYRNMVLLAGRQTEKTSLLSKDMLLDLCFGENDRLLFVTSNQNQVDEFVSLKVNSQFKFNPVLRDLSFGKSSRDNAQEKWLLNGNRIVFRAIGNNIDAARGISARKIYFDEVQNMSAKGVAVTQECASHYTQDSAYIFAGTPFSSRNILSKLYAETCQKEWIIFCESCEKDNPPLGILHIDEDKPFLFCSFCGEKISSSNGRWVAQNPASTKTGFRICKLMLPNCLWRSEAHDGILDKYETYPEAQFHQEVLGLPFDVGSMPISEDEIYANCDESYSFLSPEQLPQGVPGAEIFGAIDWAWSDEAGGKAYTIFATARYVAGKIEILSVKRFFGPKYHNPDHVLNEIIDTSIRQNLTGILTDMGVGHKENFRLRDELQKRGRPDVEVFEMYYLDSGEEWRFNKNTHYYNIGRTVTLDLVFHRLKKKLYRFPKRVEIQTFAEDILNVRTQYDPDYKHIRYTQAGTGPDDFLHLLNYLSLGLEMFYRRHIR